MLLEWFVPICILTFTLNFSMGANDESMGSCYGAKSLKLKHAMILGAITEVLGSVVFGKAVATTIQGKLFSLSVFGDSTVEVMIIVLSAVMGAAAWLIVSSAMSLPTSSTHSIVGAVCITAITARGVNIVIWDEIGKIVLSWVLSPLLGGVCVSVVYGFLHMVLLRNRAQSYDRSRKAAPIVVFIALSVLGFFCLPKSVNKEWVPYICVMGGACGVGIAVHFFLVPFVHRRITENTDVRFFPSTYTDARTEKLFSYIQIGTAGLFSFARGSNDASHGAGPFALGLAIYIDGASALKGKTREIDEWVLFVGGLAMAVGLFVLGANVIKTVGDSLTNITPTNGVASEMATAVTILGFSALGLPISSTHTMVGTIYFMEVFRSNVLQRWFMEAPTPEELADDEKALLVYTASVAAAKAAKNPVDPNEPFAEIKAEEMAITTKPEVETEIPTEGPSEGPTTDVPTEVIAAPPAESPAVPIPSPRKRKKSAPTKRSSRSTH